MTYYTSDAYRRNDRDSIQVFVVKTFITTVYC